MHTPNDPQHEQESESIERHPSEERREASPPPHSLLGPAAVFYGVLMIAAIVWRFLAGRAGPFAPAAGREHLGLEAGIVLGAFLLHLLLDLYGPRISRHFARLFRSLRSILGRIRPTEAVALAALSAFGEEAFFRGALQPVIGLWPTALLFALSHFPARRDLILWPLYALGMGLVLGYLVVVAGDIWSAVLLHFAVNLFSLWYMSSSSRRGDAPPR
jgi:membrane protease YdiL (CAAX protease family)